ncbi:MAG: sugar transferase [Chthonomonas sp.]|nr:sugar transferase [Chthonomonas sp.]
MAKRLFDLVFSAIGLIVFSPILLLTALWIKLDSKGPVFYRGERTGLNGVPFRIFKFRSMVTNADKIGGPSTADTDSRITKSGKFIRKFKLDEIPQFMNVFIGDMSFVGPRPEVKKYTDMYTPEEKPILDLRPGITDWASIWNSDEGAILAGLEDVDAGYEQYIRPGKLKLQLYYRANHTVMGDIKILMYTARRIFDKSFYPSEIDAVVPRLVPVLDQQRMTHAAVELSESAREPQI